MNGFIVLRFLKLHKTSLNDLNLVLITGKNVFLTDKSIKF